MRVGYNGPPFSSESLQICHGRLPGNHEDQRRKCEGLHLQHVQLVKQNYILKVILLHETRKILSANGKFLREWNDFRVNKF